MKNKLLLALIKQAKIEKFSEDMYDDYLNDIVNKYIFFNDIDISKFIKHFDIEQLQDLKDNPKIFFGSFIMSYVKNIFYESSIFVFQQYYPDSDERDAYSSIASANISEYNISKKITNYMIKNDYLESFIRVAEPILDKYLDAKKGNMNLPRMNPNKFGQFDDKIGDKIISSVSPYNFNQYYKTRFFILNDKIFYNKSKEFNEYKENNNITNVSTGYIFNDNIALVENITSGLTDDITLTNDTGNIDSTIKVLKDNGIKKVYLISDYMNNDTVYIRKAKNDTKLKLGR